MAGRWKGCWEADTIGPTDRPLRNRGALSLVLQNLIHLSLPYVVVGTPGIHTIVAAIIKLSYSCFNSFLGSLNEEECSFCVATVNAYITHCSGPVSYSKVFLPVTLPLNTCFCLLLAWFRPRDGDSTYLRNIGLLLKTENRIPLRILVSPYFGNPSVAKRHSQHFIVVYFYLCYLRELLSRNPRIRP
jgi:hypothetical protein